MSLSPKRGGLAVGQTLELTASVTGSGGGQGVRWLATGGSLQQRGSTTVRYTAPATAGMYTVTATSVADSTQSASTTFGVTDLSGVFTYHNDAARDGANTQEYALTTANVNDTTFGKLFSCTVDGAVYAQPLWAPGLTITGARHNVVFVATTHDTVYAYDADVAPCQMLWSKSLLGAGETWVDQSDVANDSIQPDIGIIGTPVIDAAAGKLFVVAKSKVSGGNCSVTANCHQRLHGLKLVDGTEPVAAAEIGAAMAVPGSGDGAANGMVAFNTVTENQRAGLALSSGVIYVAWGGHGDNPPFHGWVAAFAEKTLSLTGMFNATPNGSGGGVWMSGGAPSIDANGNLYLLTGNGTFDAASGGSGYGDSTLKLSGAPGLAATDYFTPADQQSLDSGDIDHGAGGAAILMDQPAGSPHQHLLLGGGKEGNLYLLDRDHLGGYGANASPADSNAVQSFSIGTEIRATGAFWNGTLYIGGSFQSLKAFAFNATTGLFNPVPTSQGAGANYGFGGGTPSISANGASNGIVWALDNGQNCSSGGSCGPTVLHAYDATNLDRELWNSAQAAGARDAAGNAVKFTVPTVANGKVYVGTRGNNQGGVASSTSIAGELDVYGLLPN